ncbi:uncharacterized protein RHOBADRAFT_65814 [Rhodotorula graminis WP1]|uniref:Uncharacterized protein n=1 Tax=Rhodotorula graminis (strain WP1) TaxID=578459 RepID=A0A0P9GVI7_RHOGW|nr:uncharacterized protein RHOBADRAFT_65814 [Rhodotorula graminis WP1]KPV71487.1 hypothetical protein RHOBADRAFT_65814 [Rhodotorula graminis WP1]
MHLFEWFVRIGFANGKQSTRFYPSSLRGTARSREHAFSYSAACAAFHVQQLSQACVHRP